MTDVPIAIKTCWHNPFSKILGKGYVCQHAMTFIARVRNANGLHGAN